MKTKKQLKVLVRYHEHDLQGARLTLAVRFLLRLADVRPKAFRVGIKSLPGCARWKPFEEHQLIQIQEDARSDQLVAGGAPAPRMDCRI